MQAWQLQLPTDSLGAHDTLLDGNRLTNVCESWACSNVDVEAELAERQFMKSVLDICQALDAPGTYARFRRLLIERPVLTALEFQILLTESEFAPLTEQLRAAYLPAPANCLAGGMFYRWSKCGNLLMRSNKNSLICENERCLVHGISPSNTTCLVEKKSPTLHRGPWFIRVTPCRKYRKERPVCGIMADV
jgi:hypothetical protein